MFGVRRMYVCVHSLLLATASRRFVFCGLLSSSSDFFFFFFFFRTQILFYFIFNELIVSII